MSDEVTTEDKCHVCGGQIYQNGSDKGQCINSKCGVEHTVINAMPPEHLTDAEYRDFYG